MSSRSAGRGGCNRRYHYASVTARIGGLARVSEQRERSDVEHVSRDYQFRWCGSVEIVNEPEVQRCTADDSPVTVAEFVLPYAGKQLR